MENTIIQEVNILNNLNEVQQEAVTGLTGPILVIAGAGSGKTRVLIHRVAYLISRGVSPYNILAVTFTNKATSEMKSRLISNLGEDIVKQTWIGTFHNICGRLLRHNIEKLDDGRKSNFVIFDDGESTSLIKQVLKELNLDEARYKPKTILSMISTAKNNMICAYDYTSNAEDYFSDKVGRIYHKYEELLIKNNAIDFDDMLMLSVKLLKTDPETAEYYQNRFEHLLVDEFQDTNTAQYELIKLLSQKGHDNWENRSLFVVGDVDQSIYSWRGADYKIILGFQQDFKETKIYKLEQNYRSVQSILDLANSIIEKNTERLEKNLFCTKGKGEKPLLYQANDESAEALYITKEISRLISRDFRPSDIAVLYRTNAQSRAIEEAMVMRNLPYRIVGGTRFYDRKEIKDILAYLKIIYNPSDAQSIKRVINEPKRAIGKTTIEKIDQISASNIGYSYFDILKNADKLSELSPRTLKSIAEFVHIIEYIASLVGTVSLQNLIEKVTIDTGYLKMLQDEGTIEDQTRIENIEELINVASEFETREQTSNLGDFLTQVSLYSDLDSLPENTSFVTLMTLHSAKGLEFPVVFLSGLEEGIFPHFRSLENDSEMEEERRLMYVGVTRAMQLLYLTYAQKRRLHGDYKYLTISRFLKELPANLIAQKTINVTKNIETKRVERPNDYSVSFGKDFVAPIIKKQDNKPVVKNIIQKSPVEKGLVEKRKVDQCINIGSSSKPSQHDDKSKTTDIELFNKGDKVYHQRFGLGYIETTIKISDNIIYSVVFEESGKKALDAKSAKLTKIDN
jgi:DNA helicase-2/ATP-dependent DNA helicase PcrA